MKEPKKVALTTPPQGPSRRQLARQMDLEIHAQLAKLGVTSRHKQIGTGSKIVDKRIRTQIGDYKGDPTVGYWHGATTGCPKVERKIIED